MMQNFARVFVGALLVLAAALAGRQTFDNGMLLFPRALSGKTHSEDSPESPDSHDHSSDDHMHEGERRALLLFPRALSGKTHSEDSPESHDSHDHGGDDHMHEGERRA